MVFTFKNIKNMTFGSWRNLNLIFWILLLVVSAESSLNEPELYYTCDESGLHIEMTFDRPFKGLVYIKGYSADPNCRLSLPVSTLEASFDIPLMACDTLVRPFPGSSPWLKGFIVIQQHIMIPTVDDSSEPFVCVTQKNTNSSWSEVLRKANYALNDSPKVYSWLDFELLPGVLSEEKSLHFLPSSSYLFLYVNGVRQFNDMIVTDCIAHGESFLLPNTSIHQMTDPNGCSNALTTTLSPFSLMRNDRGLIIGAYSEINPVQIPNLEKGFISCSAVLCKYKCECTKDISPIGYEMVFTRKFPNRIKRSITEEMTSSSSNRNYLTRNSLMRSTVKALAERLMKYRRQPRLEKETDFEKRVSFSENEATTIMNTDDYTSSFTPTEHFPSTEFSTDLISNIEIHKLDTKNLLTVNISTTLIPKLEVEKMLTNLVELPTMTESSLNHYTTLKDRMTLIPELDLNKNFNLIEQSTTDAIPNYETTEYIKEPRQKHEDFISTANVTTDPEDLGQKVGNKSIVAEESYVDQSYCVPKLKFVAVTTVLSFVIFCMILVSCGLVLYLRKEKKKHAIDNFLLYNYY